MSEVEQAQISLDRDIFLRRLLRELAGSLQNILGIDEASEYISIVGEAIGKQVNTQYRQALSVDRLSASQVADVMVDLKDRIEGSFFIIEQTEDRIVLGNRACPFGDMVRDRPSLCMMTSNVFGHITAKILAMQGSSSKRRSLKATQAARSWFTYVPRAHPSQECAATSNETMLRCGRKPPDAPSEFRLNLLSEHFWPREHRPLSLIEAQPYRSEQ